MLRNFFSVSQLVFASIISDSNPNTIIVLNMIAAGLTKAGFSQSGDIAFDFKVGHIVGALPEVQLYGQIIGSVFGTFVSVAFYKLYTSNYAVPEKLFQILAAFMNVRLAVLIKNELSESVINYVIAFDTVFTITSIVQLQFEHC